MKGIFWGNDVELKSQIVSLGENITDMIMVSNMDEFELVNQPEYRFVVLSDRSFSVDMLSDFLNTKKFEYVFYLISNNVSNVVVNNVKLICSTLDVIPILPKQSNQGIARQIVEKIEKKEFVADKVVSFFSAMPNIGATHAIYCVAHRLAELTQESIALVITNPLDSGEMYCDYKGIRLPDVKEQVNTKLMTASDLKQKMHKAKENLYILAGNNDMRARHRYPTETIENLVSTLKNEFSIILLDSGSSVENNLTITSIMQSEMRFMFLTQSEKAVKMTTTMYDQILKPLEVEESSVLGVLLKEEETLSLTRSDLTRKTKINIIGGLPLLEDRIFDRIDSERKTVLEIKGVKRSVQNRFQSEIDKVVRMIASNFRIKTIRKPSSVNIGSILSVLNRK